MSRLGEAVDVATCGMGLAAAGARAAALMASRVDDACLVGLAGTLWPDRLPSGVVLASAVEVEGIGFGTELAFEHPSRSRGPAAEAWVAQASARPWMPELAVARHPILSVASASGDEAHARLRRERHPACAIEEMEGEAVMQAATALGRRVAILRGISNVAGDRDHARWRVAEAGKALRETLDAWLQS